MSMVDYYGDYGMAEAAALRTRRQKSIANQQAAFLGQQRGTRNIANLRRQFMSGFMPKMAEYGNRGLAGPNVQSGIQRKGLESYVAKMQEDLGTEQQNLQDTLNQIAMDEASSQSDLEQYLADLRRQKQQEIINTATALKQYAAY